MISAQFKSLPLLLLPPLLWAGNVIVARAVRGDVPPLTLAFLRWSVSLLILLPFALPTIRRDWALYARSPRLLAATSLTGIAAFNTLIYSGVHHTTGTNALLLNSCIPALIMLIGMVFYRQRPLRHQLVGLVLSLLGVAAIILHGSVANLLALRFNSGDVWVFLAMVCWAFYTLWMRQLPPEINRTGLTAVQIALALPLLAVLFACEYAAGARIRFSEGALAGIAYVSIFPSVVAYLCYSAAIARFGAVRAGMSIHLMPVFGVLLAVLLLGEMLHGYHLFGIAAIVVGLVLGSKAA